MTAAMRRSISSLIGSVFNRAAGASSTLLSMGYNAKETIVNSIFDALEKLGIKKPRNRREKIKELKVINDVIEEKIEDLQEQQRENVAENHQPNATLLQDQNGAKKYRIVNTHIKTLEKLKDYVMPIIREKTIENIKTKLNVIVKITLQHPTKKDAEENPLTKPFHLEHKAKMIPQENWFEPQFDDLWEIMSLNLYQPLIRQSGWRLRSIDYTDFILSNYDQAGGHGYQPLPKWIGNRGGIINPKSRDGECFRDAIAIAANLDYFKGRPHLERITQIHKDLVNEFDFSGIGPYPGEKEYNLFIKNNPSVNLKVYHPDPFRKNFITGCFKTPVIKQRLRLVELFLDNTGEGHYSAIKNKSALLSKQMTGKKMKKCYFCDRCDNVFKSEKKRDTHQDHCFGLRTRKYPPCNKKTGSPPKMKFKNISGMSVVPFVCSADGECFLEPTYILKGQTKLEQRHKVSCWGYYYEGPFGRKEYYDFFHQIQRRSLCKV